jgi:membrane protein DedA with SNARE-associated domain
MKRKIRKNEIYCLNIQKIGLLKFCLMVLFSSILSAPITGIIFYSLFDGFKPINFLQHMGMFVGVLILGMLFLISFIFIMFSIVKIWDFINVED